MMIANSMAWLCEKILETPEMYQKLHKFSEEFLIGELRNIIDDPEKCHLEFELIKIIGIKE
jgi:hypothetical protein